ncbi:unnamed protein product [Ambrosiozyma monospora]|uniref:Unnamed protein product n=1 Tax=Ambrosiozyma monospora TaxID=43982 RepID=A0ACB5STR2_AMBMO|nr:unnamed protein product [Ambrosiozyma monospora]
MAASIRLQRKFVLFALVAFVFTFFVFIYKSDSASSTVTKYIPESIKSYTYSGSSVDDAGAEAGAITAEEKSADVPLPDILAVPDSSKQAEKESEKKVEAELDELKI